MSDLVPFAVGSVAGLGCGIFLGTLMAWTEQRREAVNTEPPAPLIRVTVSVEAVGDRLVYPMIRDYPDVDTAIQGAFVQAREAGQAFKRRLIAGGTT